MSLHLNSIILFQFKNYLHRQFSFSERIIGICGANGVGKTNLLDAIHYLCFTKSYFTRSNQIGVHQGSAGFRIEGQLSLHQHEETAVCILRESGKKEFSVNNNPYKKFSEHIGRYPCVVIAPDDVQLIIGSSEERRIFLDTLLSQLDHAYLNSLINYNKIMQQRNSFLKAYGDSFSKDLAVLDILDKQLSAEATKIFSKRKQFLSDFLPVVKELYHQIARRNEDLHLRYESELEEVPMDELLRMNRPKDLMLQRTTGGIHRDDLEFLLGETPFKSIASQGQRKSLLFALKLAEVEVIKLGKKIFPLLLLDDVFEKLDEQRMANLLSRVAGNEQMQIFITDTSCQRLAAALQPLNRAFQIIELS